MFLNHICDIFLAHFLYLSQLLVFVLLSFERNLEKILLTVWTAITLHPETKKTGPPVGLSKTKQEVKTKKIENNENKNHFDGRNDDDSHLGRSNTLHRSQ